jgi:ABC-type branched-subunit amino acid transport system substrate-binding protein
MARAGERPVEEEPMRRLRSGVLRASAAAVSAIAVFAASGCGKTETPVTDPLAGPANAVRLYGSDGNMLNAVGERLKDYPDSLAGMKGTAPFTRLPRTFRDRLRTIDRGLKDDLYSGEAYDAVAISALAAQIAGSTRSRAIAGQITGVTTGGTECDSVARCLQLIGAGQDIAYRGYSLRLGGFTDAGEPAAGTYGVLRFSDQNKLDETQTEFVPAGDPSQASRQRPPRPGSNRPNNEDPLRIGALLPHTGSLSSAGPPMFAGAQLAVREINQAGGILGKPVEWFDGDDGTDAAKAKATAQRLIQRGVQVIVGAGASGITKAVLPVTVAAGVVLFSPCNTAAELTTADDDGLYFRTAPPDGLQATALSDIIMRDGVRKIAIVARDDAYGKGLMDSVRERLLQAGLTASDVKTVPYNSETPDFSGLGPDIKAFDPDGVLVIGFDETADAIGELWKAGLESRVR